MNSIWYGIGHFIEWTLAFITPLDWMPVTIIILVMTFGALYWLMWQGRYNRKAKERNELM